MVGLEMHGCILIYFADFLSVAESSSRLLIFVNPKSGAGRATRIFKDKILPALQQNEIAFELIQTSNEFLWLFI